MPYYDKFYPNYRKLYPGVHISSELKHELKVSDRKMKYFEYDFKCETFVQNQEAQMALFLPSREDSYERLTEEKNIQFAECDIGPEDMLMQKLEHEHLWCALGLLSEDERKLLYLRYWNGLTQVETATVFSVSQQAVSYQEKKILSKLRKILDK